MTPDGGGAAKKWRCTTCLLEWDASLIKCKACESFQPGLSEGDIEKLKAAEEKQKSETIAKFLGTSAPKPAGPSSRFGASPSTGGFTFGASPGPSGDASSGVAFGFGAAAAAAPASGGGVVFGFGAAGSCAGDGTAPAPSSGGVVFGFGAPGGGGASASGGAASAPPGGGLFSFGTAAPLAAAPLGGGSVGFGAAGVGQAAGAGAPAGGGFRPTLALAPKVKQLERLPDWGRAGELPGGDVLVHGSGECDQLGLGDAQRERQKPTVVRGLPQARIVDLAVGALHVVCLAADGRLWSWGCNDDGALGRVSSDTSDCEPHPVEMPSGVVVRRMSCGDNHTCALDTLGRVWLWGTYKDSNGHIGIARKRKQGGVLEKSSEPAVVLEGCDQVASGANHTVARQIRPTRKVFAWGSNGCGQLGLLGGAGCGLAEHTLPIEAGKAPGQLKPRVGGGTEVDGQRLSRVIEASGSERGAEGMRPAEVQQAAAGGARALVVELPDREVPKPEKQNVLVPQEMSLDALSSGVSGVFASSECTFLTTEGSSVHGCGLNGDGQVGLGFMSMAVLTVREMPGVAGASWVGGGLHFTAALVGGKVLTWGKAEETGHGLGASAPPVLQPRALAGLPEIRTLRCGGSHSLACSAGGDAFAWGCGLTHQLANRPRDFSDPADADEDPEDELRPYRISSKQLEAKFVLLADGGAQHSVELAWGGEYCKVGADTEAAPAGEPEAARAAAADEQPAAKRPKTEEDAAQQAHTAAELEPPEPKPESADTGGAARAETTPFFGAASTGGSLFGAGTGGIMFGAASTGGSLFGAGTGGGTFGAASTGGSLFGAGTGGGTFGASSTGGSLFGAGTGGGMFGASSTGGSLFGAGAGGGMFGDGNTRGGLFGAGTGGGVFGAASSEGGVAVELAPAALASVLDPAEPAPAAKKAASATFAAEQEPAAPALSPCFAGLAAAADEGKWKCDVCSLKWDADLIKCKACEAFKPGMSEEDIAASKAAEEKKKQDLVAMFRSPSATGSAFSGFGSVGAGASGSSGSSGVAFGAISASHSSSGFAFGAALGAQSSGGGLVFGASPAAGSSGSSAFGAAQGAQSSGGGFTFGASPGAQSSSGGFTFGAAASDAASSGGGSALGSGGGFAFGAPAGSQSASGITFGFAGHQPAGFNPALPAAGRKRLAQAPDLARQGEAPVGLVFVHGSGECDQLGLGDSQRTRQKPTLVKGLGEVRVCDVAVGALHVLCVSADGRLFSWGCNDDGALGRASSGDSDCLPGRVTLPGDAPVQRVSCGDSHSAAVDRDGSVWLWGTYKDANGHIGIARGKQDPVVEKSAEPASSEGCSRIASGANHTVALGPGGRAFAWGSNGTGQLGLEGGEGCGLREEVVGLAGGRAEVRQRDGGGTELNGLRVVRVREQSGAEADASAMSVAAVQAAVAAGAAALVLEAPERSVPKAEKQRLLLPREISRGEMDAAAVTDVFASAEERGTLE
ncbi:unnamed protein product [Prorocentrum cordatum]|uniref:RanBP2-type domain-containing protein n=1 Tax=Prorocentrum cordatum TaxID=2364126 RepID=A0ABN9VZC2_9DINO|nr:unnamed protein product [Polarella glacialis]